MKQKLVTTFTKNRMLHRLGYMLFEVKEKNRAYRKCYRIIIIFKVTLFMLAKMISTHFGKIFENVTNLKKTKLRFYCKQHTIAHKSHKVYSTNMNKNCIQPPTYLNQVHAQYIPTYVYVYKQQL